MKKKPRKDQMVWWLEFTYRTVSFNSDIVIIKGKKLNTNWNPSIVFATKKEAVEAKKQIVKILRGK